MKERTQQVKAVEITLPVPLMEGEGSQGGHLFCQLEMLAHVCGPNHLTTPNYSIVTNEKGNKKYFIY